MAGLPTFPLVPPDDETTRMTVPLAAYREMAALNAQLAKELDQAEAKIRDLSRQLIEERARVTELTLKIADYIRIWDAQLSGNQPSPREEAAMNEVAHA